MGWISGLAIYIVIWWVVLFAVLPWGVRRNTDARPGLDRGAPDNPRIVMKLTATTAISAVVWLAFYAVVQSGLLSLRDL